MGKHILAIAIAAVLACSGASAAERRIVVGVEELNYYPAYAVLDGGFAGAAREILDAFGRDNGIRIDYRPLPIKRLYAEMLNGGIDAKFPDNPGWAADVKQGHKVAYSGPVIAFIDGVMVTPGALGQKPDTVAVLGTVAGFTPFAWLNRIEAGKVQIRENPKLELLLRQAVIKRVDGAYVNVAVAKHMMERVLAMPGALEFDPGLPHSRDHYRLSSTTNPALIAEFDGWLAANAARVALIKQKFHAEAGVE